MKRNQVEKICKACDKPFFVRNYRKDTAKFCSHFCQKHKQYEPDKKQYVCFGCKKEFTDSPSRNRKKFCSMDCRTLSSDSVKERRKKAKISKLKTRGTTSTRVLRKYIFSIKEAKCEICSYNKRTYCLDLHHIDHNPNNNSIDNIAVLCALCHRELHKGDIQYASKKGKITRNDKQEYIGTRPLR